MLAQPLRVMPNDANVLPQGLSYGMVGQDLSVIGRCFDEVEEAVSSRLDMGHLPKESERRNAKGDCIFEQSSW